MTMRDDYIPTFVCLPGMDFARFYVNDHSVYVDVSGSTEPFLRRRDVRINGEWTYEFWEEMQGQPSVRLLTTELAHVICNQGYMWNLVDAQIDRDIMRRVMTIYAKLTPAVDLRVAMPVSTRPAITSKKTRGLEL